jgi:adenylate kinase
MQLIFVGGIHGVGKTTLCSALSEVLGAQHSTAGELIRASSGRLETEDKSVVDVADNQRLLLQALADVRANASILLLDGHFTLINSKGTIELIPIEVYEQIAPDAFVLLTADPLVITSRLEHRDKKAYEIDHVAAHLRTEEEHAAYVSRELQVPLAIVEEPDALGKAVEFLRTITRNAHD